MPPPPLRVNDPNAEFPLLDREIIQGLDPRGFGEEMGIDELMDLADHLRKEKGLPPRRGRTAAPPAAPLPPAAGLAAPEGAGLAALQDVAPAAAPRQALSAFPSTRPYGMSPYVWSKLKQERKIAERTRDPAMWEMLGEDAGGRPTTAGPSDDLPAGAPLANHSTPGFTSRYNRYKGMMPKDQAYVQASVDALNFVSGASGGQKLTLYNAFTLFNQAKYTEQRAATAKSESGARDIAQLQSNFKTGLPAAYILVEPYAEKRIDRLGLAGTEERIAGLKQGHSQVVINELYQMWIEAGRPDKHPTIKIVHDPVLMNLYRIMDELEAKGAPVPLITSMPEQ